MNNNEQEAQGVSLDEVEAQAAHTARYIMAAAVQRVVRTRIAQREALVKLRGIAGAQVDALNTGNRDACQKQDEALRAAMKEVETATTLASYAEADYCDAIAMAVRLERVAKGSLRRPRTR